MIKKIFVLIIFLLFQTNINASSFKPIIEGREDAKIKLIYENFIHPTYRQLHGNFIDNLSIIDLLMNEGPESKKIINDSTNLP